MKEENGGKQMKDVWEFNDPEPEFYASSVTPKSEKLKVSILHKNHLVY